MKKYSSISELLALLKQHHADIEERIQALQASPVSFEEELLLKYIETRSTVKAAEFARSKGVRSPKGTVFSPGDVSSVIQSADKTINPALLRMAKEIFCTNTRAVERIYG